MAVVGATLFCLVLCIVLVFSQDYQHRDGSTLSVIDEMVSRITEDVMAKLRTELKDELLNQQQCCQQIASSSQSVKEKVDACIAGMQQLVSASMAAAATEATITTLSPSFVPGCPPGFESFEGHCYLFELKEISWRQAQKTCIQRGGYLVSINSQDEQDFIVSQLQTNYLTESLGEFWLGIVVVEDSLVWLDGTNVTFSFLNPDKRDIVVRLREGGGTRPFLEELINYRWDFYYQEGCCRNYICELEVSNPEGNTVPSTIGSNGCYPGFMRFDDHCYSIEMDKLSWIDAKQACEDSFNSYLVSINTQEEMNFLAGQIKTCKKDIEAGRVGAATTFTLETPVVVVVVTLSVHRKKTPDFHLWKGLERSFFPEFPAGNSGMNDFSKPLQSWKGDYDYDTKMYFWIGLTAKPWKLEWLDKSNVNFTDWRDRSKDPNLGYDKCMHGFCKGSLVKHRGRGVKWGAYSRRDKHYYICEMNSM